MESLITKFKASKYKYYNDTKDLCFETLDEKNAFVLLKNISKREERLS